MFGASLRWFRPWAQVLPGLLPPRGSRPGAHVRVSGPSRGIPNATDSFHHSGAFQHAGRILPKAHAVGDCWLPGSALPGRRRRPVPPGPRGPSRAGGCALRAVVLRNVPFQAVPRKLAATVLVLWAHRGPIPPIERGAPRLVIREFSVRRLEGGTTAAGRPRDDLRNLDDRTNPKADPAAAIRADLARSLRPFNRARVRKCRCVRVQPNVSLVERVNGDGECTLVVRGVLTCGSVHSCPMCAASVMGERAADIVQALDSAKRENVALTTFTLRHSHGMPLRLLRKLLAASYSEVKAGRTGQAVRDALGYIGDVKGAEQTYGTNGWHPHLHCLIFAESRIDEDHYQETLAARWKTCVRNAFGRIENLAWDILNDCVTKKGRKGSRRLVEGLSADQVQAMNERRAIRVFGSRYLRGHTLREAAELVARDLLKVGSVERVLPDATHGVDVRRCDDSQRVGYYLTKLGLELTAISTKSADADSMTPWDIARAAVSGSTQHQSLWREHAMAMLGARQLTWSRALRARLGMVSERTDAEILEAEQQPTEFDSLLGYVRGEHWDSEARRTHQGLLASIIRAYHAGNVVLDFVNAPINPLWRRLRDITHDPERELSTGPLDAAKKKNPFGPRPVRRNLTYAPSWWERVEAENAAIERGKVLAHVVSEAKQRNDKNADRVYMTAAERALELEEVRHHLFDLGIVGR